MDGWISLHRRIQEGWIWEEKPFSKGQAWIDLLLEANYKDNRVPIGNELVEIKRGQKLWSILDMSERWGWSRKKVSNFLNLLETDGMIEQKRTTKYTILTVVNYDFYQSAEQQKNNTGTSKEHQKNTNNKDNNILLSSNKDILPEDRNSPGYKKLEALSKKILGW